MTPTTDPEGSEDVNDFLLRIRELGERRDKEDEERTKKLEEEILQGRKEREARRAERARSISPTKDSPILDSAQLSISSLSQRAIDPPEQLEPTPQTPVYDTHSRSNSIWDDTVASRNGSPRGSRLEGSEVGTSPKGPSPSLRSRAGTLSWQQRPTSRDLSGNRPFLATSPTREGRFRAMSAASNDDRGVSRSPFASLPSSRESSFLRQTEGDEAPPAQMKNLEEDTKEASMGSAEPKESDVDEGIVEPVNENDQQDTVEEKSRSPSRASSTFADSSLGNRYSTISPVSTATGLGSPIPLSSAQKLEPTTLDSVPDGQISSPSSPSRLSPDRSRPTSPTKGLGGFVQSAMMKRSDSISKRWSAQLPSGLNRGNPFASNRNSFVAPSNVDIFSTSPTRLSREGSASSPHRPGSSHSEATIVHQTKDGERPATPPLSSGNEIPTRPPLSLHSRSTSVVSVGKSADSASLPASPATSRTMDPKRWSPTKSTWLESALNRPESPRHKRQPSQQTPWTTDRQSRTSVDLGRPSSFKEVTPVGLLRTADLQSHFKKPSISGIPDLSSPQDTENIPEGPSETPTVAKDNIPVPEAKSPEAPTPTVTEVTPATGDVAMTRKRAPSVLSPTSKANNIDRPLSSPRDPLLNRPKPQSPVIDFRANLRRRDVVKDQSSTAEPEFKNVFGKLKKTETSNYVAPDELKENILRGKAALNITGGPKKTQRVDEFKESILKQKEAMKASGGSLRRSTVGEDDAPAETVPEAIVKRRNMVNSGSFKSNASADTRSSPSPKEPSTPQTPHTPKLSISSSRNEVMERPEALQIVTTARELNVDDVEEETAPNFRSTEKELDHKTEPAEVEERSNDVAVVNAQEHAREEPLKPVRALPSGRVVQATSTPQVIGGPITKGSLAGRINPALAGLLSRGPPAPVDDRSRKGASVASSGSQSPSNAQISQSAPTLTHMTKARARGPKRRPPKTPDSIIVDSDVKDVNVARVTPSPPIDEQTLEAPCSPPEHSWGKSKDWPLPSQEISVDTASEFGVTEPFSPVTNKPTEIKRSIPRLAERDVSVASNPSTPSAKLGRILERRIYEDTESRCTSPPSNPVFTPSQPTTSPISPLASHARNSPVHYSSPSPSPLRTSLRENQPHPPPRVTGPGSAIFGSRDSSPFRKSLPSPPVPPKGPTSLDQLSSPRSSASLVPQADESLEAIARFFTTFPNSSDRVNIDPQLMLMAKSDDSKIRTLRKQICEITGDGKKQDLPANQEYILYEGAMYLCVHIFEIDGNTRSDVHLWCGDDVWDGAVDDAQAFSRRVARDNGCKLEVIKQGKEPARFIQALGGILITRRGSSSRSSSSAIFMLCGRKHLSQMVFDEVDFSPHNLCTGYPYVISAMFGKVYLWRGKGSSAEEIGAARLIGMDLGLTGEFEEVAEGEEPESFFEVFPQHREVKGYTHSDHWLLKPAHDHFRLRLLRVDHELGQRTFWIRRPGSSSPVIRPNDTVQEVEPFCQKDLSAKGIYILDTFFEIFVIVGEQASNRPAEFASAVVFAHEYGILAASLQDRPFIPKSFISLGGLPDSCRSAFRKWGWHPSRRPPQVFPLNAAIEAIRS